MPLGTKPPLTDVQHSTRLIKHPKSTNFDESASDDDGIDRPAKRQKKDGFEDNDSDTTSEWTSGPSPPANKTGSISRTAKEEEEVSQDKAILQEPRRTDLESALPPINTDKEAIEEYEATRAAEEAERYQREGRLHDRTWMRGKNSIYVDAFNLALDTVLDEESHLFNDTEQAIFEHWRALNYESQYLYVRLFLRKTSAWHRVNALGYHSDIINIENSVADLQTSREIPSSGADNHDHPGELEPPNDMSFDATFTFADDSESFITTLEEASTLLKLDELKSLGKEAKVQGKNKSELVQNLRRASQKQSGIGWASLKRSDTEMSTGSIATNASDSERTPLDDLESGGNRDAHFVRKILKETGPCVRLSQAPLKLFERVHLVFYRSTEWTEKSLMTIILARIARRNFPDYIVSRSAHIFPSRSLLLEFEAALRTQFRVDSVLEFNGTPSRADLEIVLRIHEEVYPRWQALLKEEQRKEDSIYVSGEGAYLRRLSPAWVYTRIIHKATGIFGKFKQHEREHALLDELLAQRLFHTARRGAWYQRKALLEEHYMWALRPSDGRDEEYQKKHLRRIALHTCEMGLQDPLVHLIYHYDLQKRVTKLEKALRIPKRHQHDFAHVRLAKPAEITVMGVRLESEIEASVTNENPRPPLLRRSSSGGNVSSRRGAKTVWEDPLEDSAPCGVEAMCLSSYRSRGWKGYHSEGGIVRTLFALLFYDVLFAYVPHVFQTAFQTCPLDLHCPEAFYAARLSEINLRLAEISNGQAEELVTKIWEEHSDRQTCVVGLDWGFALEDLIEILRCFKGEALATVCRIMAQEYSQRGGGVPDLFLWNPEKGEVKFAEVKSENDRLSDTQRLWIHVLSSAGITVELCHAVAKEVKTIPL